MAKSTRRVFVVVLISFVLIVTLGGNIPTVFAAAPTLISEFQPNPTGADPGTVSFEISGEPSTAFNLWILSVESDSGSGTGTIQQAENITGSFDANGIATATISDLENPSFTVILTDAFTGTVNTSDIDTNDDGTVDDTSTLGTVHDAIGVPDNVGDQTFSYGAQLGGADFTYIGDEPQLIFRDASTGDWYAIDDPVNNVYDISATTYSTSDFTADPTTATFGSINPSYSPPTNTTLSASAACNGDNLDVTITAGDGPFNITGTGTGLPSNGVSAGTHPLIGPDNWTGITVSETTGDTESNNLGDFTCPVVVATGVIINEVDADTPTLPTNDAAEFIELYDGGFGNTSLTGLTVVLFNGNGDVSYRAIDLDGQSTDANGYFVIGSSGVTGASLILPNNTIQNGADAVALYVADATDFPNGTSVTTTNLSDALVYDTNDGDDAGLLALLNPSESQVNENGNGNGATESNQRCPNGTGGQRNTITYRQWNPTPGAKNLCITIATNIIINEVDADTAGTDAAEFIELYDGGAGNTPLDGLVLVTFNGSDDQSYNLGGHTNAIDLDGYSTDTNGYFVLGNPGIASTDITFNNNSLQNGPDAVAIFIGDGSNFPNDTPVTTTNLLDALVYDTGDADDPGLLVLLNAAEPQVDEDFGGDKDNESNQRRPNGGGGQRNTSGYSQLPPTPKAGNPCSVCGNPATLISTIQGTGTASSEIGNTHTIEAIVTGDFQTSNNLRGFFVQEEIGDQDGNPASSEGIFVFDGDSPAVDVNIGDLVRVNGQVVEFFELTELTLNSVLICGTGNSVSPTTINMPVTTMDTWDQHEGMLVYFSNDPATTENYFQGQYGEVLLSTGGRLFNPTNVVEPGAAANAMQAINDLNIIQLEDGKTAQNPDPTPYLGANNTLRTGDTLPGLTGLLNYAFNAYEVHPVGPVNFTRVNGRPGSTSLDPGTLKVASFNTLNYFTTIDGSGTLCGPAQDQGCRGADSSAEFTRQRTKIINAIIAMDADVIGLMEIENHPTDDAVTDLVLGLNTIAGAGTYAKINTGTIGDDAIKVTLIYKPASVTTLGSFVVLDSSVDPNFIDTKNRPSLIQTFAEVASGEIFTVSVNHLKSKGSNCDALSDPDTGDGQGNCNLTRTKAATALANYLATDPTSSGDGDFLIIGDLNAYAMEDPIDAIKAAGYYDLIDRFIGTGAYSYVFDGQAGYLDHALATLSLKLQVKDVEEWHINADEPATLDYNDYNPMANYSPDHYRASDHDPVLISLILGDYPTVKQTDPADGTKVKTNIDHATITFSKDVLADSSAQAANNTTNYLLLESQGDGFQTSSCAAAASSGVDSADTQFVVNSVSYDAATYTATVYFNDGTTLPPGEYKLIICGTTTIVDLDGRKLNGGTSDTKVEFTTIDPSDFPFTATTVPETGATLKEGISQALITFSKDVLADYSAQAANNIANYLLLESQGDGFQTTSCAAAAASGIDPADTQIVINKVSYNAATRTATVYFNNGTLLPPGVYRLYICGTTSIEDLEGRELNGGASDAIVTFIVADSAGLPGTGFPQGVVTSLPAQPASKLYADTTLTLTIPKLGIQMPVVGVPLSQDGWDTSWLGSYAGYLEGSAFPTWTGNTVITGHVWSAQNQPGPFARLRNLSYGDLIQILAWGQTYIYQVQEIGLVNPFQVSTVMRHETLDWVTLLTCEGYQPEWDSYSYRRIVRAVLIDIQ